LKTATPCSEQTCLSPSLEDISRCWRAPGESERNSSKRLDSRSPETLAHFPTGNAVYPAASPHAVFSTPVEMTKVYRGVRLSGSGAPPGEP